MLRFRSKQLATLLILGSVPLLAQNPEAATIVRERSIATLSVDHPRPLDAIAIALAESYQLHVNAEDPEYLYAGDIRDVTAQVARAPSPQRRVLVPMGGSFHFSYPVDAAGRPVDAAALLRRIVSAFNGQSKTRYRLAEDGDVYTFIPVRSRDSRGRMAARTPLLDHRISLAHSAGTLHETFQLIADALSERTGAKVSCCGPRVNNYFQHPVTFEAREEPVREVILRLTRGSARRYQWLVRNSPGTGEWAINLLPLVRRDKDPTTGDWMEDYILWPGTQPFPPLPPPLP